MNIQKQQTLEKMLERSLRSPLPVTHVNRRVVLPGSGAMDEVITTCRFILVLKGRLNYSIEGNDYAFEKGSHFLIPSWCRRWWTASPGKGCEIVWCEFDDDPKEIHRGGCFFRRVAPAELLQEKKSYLAMLRIWKSADGVSDAERKMLFLELEGHLKGMLSRFIPRVETAPSFLMSEVRRLHPGIKKGLQWLEENYARESVLEEMQTRSGLTPNYFRTCFKVALLCSPSDYLKQLRLRRARHLLHETSWQQKRIASEVGYSDPLYFSRLYRSFWGHSPSQERLTQSYLPLK